jgi:hypothetical protein
MGWVKTNKSNLGIEWYNCLKDVHSMVSNIEQKVPSAKILLVGTKADLRKSAGGAASSNSPSEAIEIQKAQSSVRYKEVRHQTGKP